jgi:hypothetical protein
MQVIMKGKLIPVFVLAALVSCSQPPVKEQGPRPVKLADVTSLRNHSVEWYRPINSVIWRLRCPAR